MVTYVYEYRNGEKGAGAGFLKLDSRGNDCRIQLCLQGRNAREDHGVVFLVVKKEKTFGISLGEVTSRQGTIGGSWIVNRESISGSPWMFSDVMGMAVLYPSGRYLISCWTDEPDEAFIKGKIEPWSDRRLSEMEEPETLQKAAEEREETKEEGTEREETEKEETAREETAREETAREETAREETGREKNGQEETEPIAASEISQPVVHTTERIDISDIRRFPKKNWHLCSNSFVIHGFFNYHYLVCIHREEEGSSRQYLGVPGVYAKPEQAMAMLFGFPEFETLRNQNLKMQKSADNIEEKAQEITEEVPDGAFGYWCCRLEP